MGHMNIYKHMISAGVPVDQLLGGHYGLALAAVATGGELDVVNELLHAGANVNFPLAGVYGSALAAAAYWGQSDAAHLLLGRGADVNKQLAEGSYKNALSAAICVGHDAVAMILIYTRGDCRQRS